MSIKSEILRETCFTITREDDPEQEFQRRLDESRVNDIAKYVDLDLGVIPIAIVLSAQPEAELEMNSTNKIISFERNKKVFLILDDINIADGFCKGSEINYGYCSNI